MKRRRFIQTVGAMSVLGAHIPWSLAQIMPASPETVRPLIPVFDRLSEVGAESLEHYYPLLIGLGAAAETLVNQVRAFGRVPDDAGLYRTGIARKDLPANTPALLRLRLSKCCCVALLLIDGQDPRALVEGLVWARQLGQYNVPGAALLLDTNDGSFIRAWRKAVGSSLDNVIEVRTREGTLSPTASVHALLYGVSRMPFPFSYDVTDLQRTLMMGTLARTTAVEWNHPDAFPMAIANACELLQPSNNMGGAIAWLYGGLHPSFSEWDEVRYALLERLPDDTSLLVSVVGYPRLKGQRRILSLTVASDWGQEAPAWRGLNPTGPRRA